MNESMLADQHQFCINTGCSQQDLPETMDNMDGGRERVKEVRVVITSWWCIYTYILSSKDRLFLCITSLQCDSTREMFQAGIETSLTLRQTDNIPLSQLINPTQAREFNVYVLTSVCLHFSLLDTKVLNSLEELCITWVSTINSFAKVFNPRGEHV